MRLAKIKDQSDLGVFKDVIDMQVVDGGVEAIVIKLFGQELRVVSENSYSNFVKLLREEPKEEKKMFRVSGSYMGLEVVPKEFDSEYDANYYIIEMNGKLPYGEEHTLEVQPFSVFVESTKI